MAKFIRHKEFVNCVAYFRSFVYEDNGDCGYAFSCDEHGNVENPQNPNYLACLTGVINNKKVIDRGIRQSEWHYVEPGVIECDVCFGEVELCNFTNTCDVCGTDYNSSGQKLAPREQWGLETGESVADILRVK